VDGDGDSVTGGAGGRHSLRTFSSLRSFACQLAMDFVAAIRQTAAPDLVSRFFFPPLFLHVHLGGKNDIVGLIVVVGRWGDHWLG